MVIDWDVNRIIADCRKIHRGANDPNLTGWVNWPCKQDLYRVKFAVDEMLKDTGNFAGEQEWLEEQQKQQVWKALNEMQNLRK